MKGGKLVKKREVLRTICIVAEGHAEYALLQYLKRQLHPRHAGFTLKFGNARGKGALHVIDYARRQKRQIDYDLVAVLFDTDKDWTAEARKMAADHDLLLFPCVPCLEVELLKVHAVDPPGDTKTAKDVFFKKYEAEAHTVNFERYFSRPVLDDVMGRDLLVSRLCVLIEKGI